MHLTSSCGSTLLVDLGRGRGATNSHSHTGPAPSSSTTYCVHEYLMYINFTIQNGPQYDRLSARCGYDTLFACTKMQLK